MSEQHKRNAYTCKKCGGRTITIDLVTGVTPFMIRCRASDDTDCVGMAVSSMYRIDQRTPVAWGWYLPGKVELQSMSPETVEHVKRGGLLPRRLTEEELQMHNQ